MHYELNSFSDCQTNSASQTSAASENSFVLSRFIKNTYAIKNKYNEVCSKSMHACEEAIF